MKRVFPGLLLIFWAGAQAQAAAPFTSTLKNQQEEDVKILVDEPLPGDWEILSSSLPYRKVQAHLIRFEVPVPKARASKFNYRVRFRP